MIGETRAAVVSVISRLHRAWVIIAVVLFAPFDRASARQVQKVRDCPSLQECGVPKTVPPVEVREGEVRFHLASGSTKRVELARNGVVGIPHELKGSRGVLITRVHALGEDSAVESQEVLDENGNTLFTLEGTAVPGTLVAAPDMSYFIGYESHNDYEGEPYSFYDGHGQRYARLDRVFTTSSTYNAGGDVKISFCPDSSCVLVSVGGHGIAAFNREGTLRWKKIIRNWVSQEPSIFSDGSAVMVKGYINSLSFPEGQRKLSFDAVKRMGIEERRRRMLPSGFTKQEEGLYCLSISDGVEKWFEPGWGGLAAVDRHEPLIAVGRRDRSTKHFQVGLFAPAGLTRIVDAGANDRMPDLFWLGDWLVYANETTTFVPKGNAIETKPAPSGVFDIAMFSKDGQLRWQHHAVQKGFDISAIDEQHFAIQEAGQVSLFEIK